MEQNLKDVETILKSKGIFNIKGCLVTQIVGGWQLFGQNLSTPEEVLELISNSAKAMGDSLVVVNNGSIHAGSTEINPESSEKV